jgi:aminobenzoyl-glutamate utilization protein B
MNVGVQFLREHVLPSVRIHYAITDAGGTAPNVVQPKAEVRYLIRDNNITDAQEVYERVNKIALGAALMTETEVDIQFIKSCFNLLPNWTLNRALYENMTAIPLPEYTAEDRAFAEAIEASFSNPSPDPFAGAYPRLTLEEAEWIRQQETTPLMRCVLPLFHDHRSNPGSSDVGDVSWAVPTAQILAATWTANTPGHSWQATAMGKSGIAKKAMLYAGKVLAGAAIDLLNSPETVEQAKAEHLTARGGKPFVSPVPKDVKPAIP